MGYDAAGCGAGDNQTLADQRAKLDLAYIERASLWLDLCILLRTAVQIFVTWPVSMRRRATMH